VQNATIEGEEKNDESSTQSKYDRCTVCRLIPETQQEQFSKQNIVFGVHQQSEDTCTEKKS
jgi:hypothetical protein